MKLAIFGGLLAGSAVVGTGAYFLTPAAELIAGAASITATEHGFRTDKIDMPRPKYDWPDTECPKGIVSGGTLSDGLHQYKIQRVSAERCQWVVDAKAEDATRRDEYRKADLWHALQTRVLSDAEMREVVDYGEFINTQMGVSYSPDEKGRERANALMVQGLLRDAARATRPTNTTRGF